MLGNAFVFKPFTQATDSHTGSLSNSGITIPEPSFDDWPNFAHQWGHELAATFNNHTQGEHGTTSMCRISRREILHDERAKRWEYLIGWQVGRESVDDTECGLEIFQRLTMILKWYYVLGKGRHHRYLRARFR
jgi:hypothetical protein